MKHFKSNEELITSWQYRTNVGGYTENMRFEGDNLYSYDKPIARITHTPTNRVIYLNTDKYSPTTTKQTNIVAKLASNLTLIERVNELWFGI